MQKTVVVTGVTRGIGKQIAIDLANEGNIKTFKCDITDKIQVENTAKEILKNNSIYAVINNAGVAKTSLFCDVSEKDFNFIMNTNVKGTFLVTKAFLPNMINKKQGRIVNISSIWGVCGGSCEVVYSTSKSAIIGMTKALARELGPSSINVNCVAPGVIETDMISNLTKEDKKELACDTSLQRNGTPKDISGVVSFLLGENADFITGQVITVDGGFI